MVQTAVLSQATILSLEYQISPNEVQPSRLGEQELLGNSARVTNCCLRHMQVCVRLVIDLKPQSLW